MKTPERTLDNYVEDVCEHTEVRRGGSIAVGDPLNLGAVSTLPCSAVTPAAFGWNCLINTRTKHRPGLLISIPHAIAPVMCVMYGLQGFVLVNYMPTGWMARINLRKGIVSISTSCFWILLR